MKKYISLIFLFFAGIRIMFGQSPESFNYQAVARNATGELIVNQNIGFRFSILFGSIDGISVFTETHTVMSNNYGICNVKVGDGTLERGNVSMIDWSAGAYFLKVEVDISGGINYTHIGTS